jgi:hypothetical protein
MRYCGGINPLTGRSVGQYHNWGQTLDADPYDGVDIEFYL